MPNPDEVASIDVGDYRFDDWESVWVQIRWADAYPLFRFTAAERDDLPPLWTRLQLKPGDECAIYLGGQLAIAGFILTRQTAYDAKSHAVELRGVGRQWAAARASVITKTGNFDDKTFQQVAEEVLEPTGVKLKPIGQLDETKFPRLQANPGDSIWSFLERIARPRGIVLGTDKEGNILAIGQHKYVEVDGLIEGVNILKCQCVITIENTRSDFRARGSTAASDGNSGPQASEQEARVPGSLKRYSPLLVPAEQPVWSSAELATRASHEAKWNEGTIVTANIEVYGWFDSHGNLWRAGDKVWVQSPMAMLDMAMKIQTVTFTQDSSSGTKTTFELVAPWLLNDSKDFRPGAPPPPEPATTNTGPAESPPAAKTPEPPPSTMPPASH